ncbi:FtsQ-type POTRA domain-containing protein [Utexia brackfieldae]|uniref:FtsQ-type POTRA domain-containing protein n=1 Tax=Utexia brackfieldae TaxID=3074108 RepID=UPI00370D9FF5
MKKVRQAAPKKVINKKKRRWLFQSTEQIVGFFFFLFVIATTVWVVDSLVRWLDNPEQAVLSQLTITGDRQFTRDQDIREAILSLGLPDTFVGQDVDVIQQEVLRLPWIKQVSVRKQWPDKLIVNILEYHPIAHWNDAFLLDEQGTVFSLPPDRLSQQDLPLLYGPENKEPSVLEMYQHFSTLMAQMRNDQDQVKLVMTSISVNERYSWSAKIKPCIKTTNKEQGLLCMDNQNIDIIIGRKKLDDRLKRFMMIYPEIQAQTTADERIHIVDLRYDNGAAVERSTVINK